MNRKSILSHFQEIFQSLILIILIIMIILMMIDIKKIQGTARVINYAGIVRGATQRLIKLEITNNPNYELEERLDRILLELKNGGNEFDLIKLEDENYQQKLETLSNYWILLKDEIVNVRIKGHQETNIVKMSEEYFHLADETVSAAEDYAEKRADEIQIIENISIIMIVFIICMIIKQSIHIIKTNKMNKQLAQQAYIDEHTKLPNKNQCERILKNYVLTNKTCCIMFDLNNLKIINDTLGHIEGDKIISDFAHILKDTFSFNSFVGRYGGDEFITITEDTDVTQILDQLQKYVNDYNKTHQSHISYAFGYALSSDYPQYSIKALLDKADQHMYRHKQSLKKQKTL